MKLFPIIAVAVCAANTSAAFEIPSWSPVNLSVNAAGKMSLYHPYVIVATSYDAAHRTIVFIYVTTTLSAPAEAVLATSSEASSPTISVDTTTTTTIVDSAVASATHVPEMSTAQTDVTISSDPTTDSSSISSSITLVTSSTHTSSSSSSSANSGRNLGSIDSVISGGQSSANLLSVCFVLLSAVFTVAFSI